AALRRRRRRTVAHLDSFRGHRAAARAQRARRTGRAAQTARWDPPSRIVRADARRRLRLSRLSDRKRQGIGARSRLGARPAEMTSQFAPIRPGRVVENEIVALEAAQRTVKTDAVVTEDPLELRLSDGARTRTLAITMRTPGNDFELAAGFAFDESLLRERA